MRKLQSLRTSLLILFISLALPAFARAADDVSFADYYGYDKAIPLNAAVTKRSETDKYIIYNVLYDSVRDMRVPGLLMMPKTPGRHACFVFGHGFGGNKNDILDFADTIASHNICMMSIDMQYSGDRAIPGRQMYSKQLYNSRDALHESVLDFRRAVDFLESRKDVDKKKIGYVGGSMGGLVGGVLCGIETRIRACVLVVGGADWSYLLKHSIVSHGLGLVYGKDRVTAEDGRVILGPVDPINFAQLIAPRPLLMLNGINDSLVNPQSNKILFARAQPPKKIVWYATGHELPHEPVLEEAAKWFEKFLMRGEKPDFTSVVEGWKTAPLPMPEIKLPAIRTGMTFEDYYGYNKSLPLEGVEEPAGEGTRIFELSYVSDYDRRVTAYMFLPATGSGPFPVIILQKTDAWVGFEEERLAEAGFAAIWVPFIPNPGREIPMSVGHAGLHEYPYRTRDIYEQSVTDMRRLADYLEALPNIDTKRMGAIGFMEGAVTVSIAAGLDPRFRAAALVDANYSKYPSSQIARIMAPVDPSRFVGRISPRSTLIVTFSDKAYLSSSKRLFEFASKPRALSDVVFDGDINTDLIGFFRENLK